MSNKVPYKIYENIGTIFWFVMDFCWLSDSNIIAIYLGFFAVCFLGISASNTFFNDECKISDRCSYIASWLWCICNTFWLISSTNFGNNGQPADVETTKNCLDMAKLAFILASIMIIMSIILSKFEKNEINLKRFK